MKRIKTMLAIPVMLAAICLGCFLPKIVSYGQDAENAGNITVQDITSIGIDLASSLSIYDKLEIVRSAVYSQELETGKYMNAEQAMNTIYKEVDSFITIAREYGIQMPDIYTKEITNYFVSNMIASDESSEGSNAKSGIFWFFSVNITDASILDVVLDDETGKILSISMMWQESMENSVISESSNDDNIGSIYSESINTADMCYILGDIYTEYLGLDCSTNVEEVPYYDYARYIMTMSSEAGEAVSIIIMIDSYGCYIN